MAVKKSKSGSAASDRASKHALEGAKAPAFELPDSAGVPVKLKDLIGRGNLVLYFYPKDMTPGCTREACDFQDRSSAIAAAGARVAGVSGDSSESHQKFAAKYGLKFPLLADADHRVAKLYGVWKKKSLYGREFMGIERTTFVIDKAGVIRRVFPKVKVEGHPEAVIEALKQLG
jgi:thioredoxin-dependent peroxiredoxin